MAEGVRFLFFIMDFRKGLRFHLAWQSYLGGGRGAAILSQRLAAVCATNLGATLPPSTKGVSYVLTGACRTRMTTCL